MVIGTDLLDKSLVMGIAIPECSRLIYSMAMEDMSRQMDKFLRDNLKWVAS